MARVRRTVFAFYYLEDDFRLDPAALLRGELPSAPGRARVRALALLTGERHRLTLEEFDAVAQVTAGQWIDDRDSTRPR